MLLSSMPKIIKISALILTLFVIVIVFLFIRGLDEGVRLSRLLSDVNISRIEVDGKAYSIKNGRVEQSVDREASLKVLRLAAFYQWNKEDPLFESPDFDRRFYGFSTHKLSENLELLGEETRKLQEILNQKRPPYPMSFLHDLARTSISTKQFIKSPSLKGSRELIEKQKNTASSYGEEAGSLLKFISPVTDGGAVSFNIRLTHKIILEDLGKIIKNTKNLISEIEKREGCLDGTGECIRPMLDFSRPKNITYSNPPAPTFLDIKLIYVRGIEQRSLFGPYRASTPCFGWGEKFSFPEHYFYVSPSGDIRLATDAYYRRTGINLTLGDLGTDHIFIPTNLAYLCPYAGYILEAGQVALFLEKYKPIFTTLDSAPKATQEFFQEAGMKEKEFFNQKHASYNHLRNLSQYYAYAYRLLTQDPNAAFAQNLLDQKEEFLRRYLEIDRKIGFFNRVLENMAPLTISTRKNYELIPTDIQGQAKFVYTYKNYYGLFFLPFTTSIWRSSEQLQYLEKRKIENALGLEAGYINYNEAVKHVSREEIDKWYVDIPSLIEELLERKKNEKNRLN